MPSGVATVSTSFGRLSRLKFVKEKDRRPQRPTILPGRHTIALLLRVTVIKSPTLLLLFLACALSPAVAQHQHQIPMERAPSSGSQIVVTINPEARVNAVIGDALPRPNRCNTPMPLAVKVFNQGGITAPLRAHLVDAPQYITIHMDGSPLSGQPEEKRLLHVILSRPEATDITIAFSVAGDEGDLVDRDRVHVLVRCERQ